MTAPAWLNNGTLAENAGVASISPSLPTSRTAGNILIAVVGTRNTETHACSTSGWAQIPGLAQTNSASGQIRVSYWWRIVDGTETAPTFTWTSTTWVFAQIIQYTRGNTDTVNPFGAIGTPSTGSGNPHTSASITTTRNNSLAIYFDVTFLNSALATPAGWSERFDNGAITAGFEFIGGDKTITTSGTASGAISVNGGATDWIQVQIELREPNIAQVVNATASTATTVVKRSGKVVLALSSAVATMTKRAWKPVSALSTGATTVVKRAGKRVSAVSASATSVVKRAGKAFSAAVATATSLSGLRGVLISVSVATSVALRRQVSKAVSAASAITTFVVKRAGKSITAASTTSAAVLKRVGKIIGVTLSSVVVLSRSINKVISFSIITLVNINKLVRKTLSLIGSIVVTIVKRRAIEFSVALMTSVNFTRSISVVLSTFIGTLVSVVKITTQSWFPVNVYRSGVWVLGKLRIYRDGEWVMPNIKRWDGTEWIDMN